MSRFFRFSLLFFLIPASACTYLGTRHKVTWRYHSATRCAQGPFELKIPSVGAKWGEVMTLAVYSPRKLGIRVDYKMDDEAQFRTTWVGSEAEMENKECLAAEGAPGTPAGPGDTVTPEAPGKTLETPTGITPPPGDPDAPPPGLVSDGPDTSRNPGAPDTTQKYFVSLLNLSRHHPDGEIPLKKGRFLILRLWSTLPNDLEGVSIHLKHEVYWPEPNEKEYIAKWRKDERERQKKAEARKRAAERRQREWIRQQELRAKKEQQRKERERLLAAKNPPKPKPVQPARAAKPAKPVQPVWQWCVTGRLDGGRVQICRKFTDYAEFERCRRDAKDIPCWHRKQPGRWHYSIAEAPKPQPPDDRPKPRPADGPPPSPRAETPPPRASLNAVWVPGYWRWNGFAWLWLSGFWRVPESDLAEEKTATAPAEPPPLKVETVEVAPFPDAVWTPGYWHWVATAWVWVPGRWLVPPAAGQAWQRPQWRRTPRGVILIPGRWLRR